MHRFPLNRGRTLVVILPVLAGPALLPAVPAVASSRDDGPRRRGPRWRPGQRVRLVARGDLVLRFRDGTELTARVQLR
jgi:hypothetical protein